MRIAICDDIAADRAALRQALIEAFPRRTGRSPTLLEYDSGEALLADAGAAWDLLFLDIFMGGMSGIDAARQLRTMGVNAPVVFLTTSPDFAVESYELGGLDYLLKPVQPERLERTLDRLRKPREAAALNLHGERLDARDILFVESQHNDLLIYCRNGATRRQRLSMTEAEKTLLQLPNFLKCHQSFLINMDYVEAVDDDFHFVGGLLAPIRVRERRKLREQYFHYVFQSQREEGP